GRDHWKRRDRLTWCCSGRSSFLALLGRMLAAEHQDVGRTKEPAGMSAEEELDAKIPVDAVLRATHRFLTAAGWVLEFDGQLIPIPREPEPAIISRAFIKAHAPDVFLDDHFEAVVALD